MTYWHPLLISIILRDGMFLELFFSFSDIRLIWSSQTKEVTNSAPLHSKTDRLDMVVRVPPQYKDRFSRFDDFYYKDKTVMRPWYLYNGNPYTCKAISMYCGGPLCLVSDVVSENRNILSAVYQIEWYACSSHMWSYVVAKCAPIWGSFPLQIL